MSRAIRYLPICLCLLASALYAQKLSINGTTDKDVAIYQPGEPIVFTLRVLDDGKPVMGATHAELDEDLVRPGGEVAIAEEEQVLRHAQLLLPQEEKVAAGGQRAAFRGFCDLRWACGWHVRAWTSSWVSIIDRSDVSF